MVNLYPGAVVKQLFIDRKYERCENIIILYASKLLGD
jgi:hypothetical protein